MITLTFAESTDNINRDYGDYFFMKWIYSAIITCKHGYFMHLHPSTKTMVKSSEKEIPLLTFQIWTEIVIIIRFGDIFINVPNMGPNLRYSFHFNLTIQRSIYIKFDTKFTIGALSFSSILAWIEKTDFHHSLGKKIENVTFNPRKK